MKMLLSIITMVFNIVTALLGIRFLLILFAARPSVLLVQWLYDASAPLVAPVRGAVAPFYANGITLDIDTLLALLFYALVQYLLTEFIFYIYKLNAVREAERRH